MQLQYRFWDSSILRCESGGIHRQTKSSNGICRPLNSAWGSDVVLIRKKDEQMRFAIDNRQLNAAMRRDAYGPPNPQSIHDKPEERHFFSCLDVAIAYSCIPLRVRHSQNRISYTERSRDASCAIWHGKCRATFKG